MPLWGIALGIAAVVVVVGAVLGGGAGETLYRGFRIVVTNIAIEGGSAWTWRAECMDEGCGATFTGGPRDSREDAARQAQAAVDAYRDGVGGGPRV